MDELPLWYFLVPYGTVVLLITTVAIIKTRNHLKKDKHD